MARERREGIALPETLEGGVVASLPAALLVTLYECELAAREGEDDPFFLSGWVRVLKLRGEQEKIEELLKKRGERERLRLLLSLGGVGEVIEGMGQFLPRRLDCILALLRRADGCLDLTDWLMERRKIGEFLRELSLGDDRARGIIRGTEASGVEGELLFLMGEEKKAVEEAVERGVCFFSEEDKIAVEKVADRAATVFYLYAKEKGVEEAVKVLRSLPLGKAVAKANGLMGVTRAVIEEGGSWAEVKGIMREKDWDFLWEFYPDARRWLLAAYLRCWGVMLESENFDPEGFSEFGEEITGGKELRPVKEATRRWLRVWTLGQLERLRIKSKEEVLREGGEILEEIQTQVPVEVQREERWIDRVDIIRRAGAAVRALYHLGVKEAREEGRQILLAVAREIEKERSAGLLWVVADELIELGFLPEAWEIFLKLEDGWEKKHLATVIAEKGVVILEKIDRRELVRLLENQGARVAEALGFFYPEVEREVVEGEEIGAMAKAFFLLGKAVGGDRKALAKAVRYLKGEGGKEWIRRIGALPLGYKVAVSALFQVLEHKKGRDYTREVPASVYAWEAIKTLLELGNPKAKGIAMELFANDEWAKGRPGIREEMFRVLVKKGCFPSGLEGFWKKKGGGTEWLDFIAFLIREHGVVPSPLLLRMVGEGVETVEEMEERIVALEQVADRYRVAMSPVSRALAVLEDGELGVSAFYLSFAMKEKYGAVRNFGRATLERLLEGVARLRIDGAKMEEFKAFLRERKFTKSEAERVARELEEGRYPFGEDKRRHRFEVVSNSEFEKKEWLARLNELVKGDLWVLRICARKGIAASLREECWRRAQETEEFWRREGLKAKEEMLFGPREFNLGDLQEWGGEGWREMFWGVAREIAERLPSETARVYDEVKREIGEVLEWLERVEKRKVRSFPRGKSYELEVVEKGDAAGFMLFARATDAVRSCVSSSSRGYLGYMPHRLVDPFSFTVVIRDLKGGEVVGNAETRIGVNEETGSLELFVVGLYSVGKEYRHFVKEVVEFLERAVALPLRLAAVNIASKHGGKFEKPRGYREVSGLRARGFSAVVDVRGRPALRRGDDIIKDYDYRRAPGVDLNRPFEFEGYRKEFSWLSE